MIENFIKSVASVIAIILLIVAIFYFINEAYGWMQSATTSLTDSIKSLGYEVDEIQSDYSDTEIDDTIPIENSTVNNSIVIEDNHGTINIYIN